MLNKKIKKIILIVITIFILYIIIHFGLKSLTSKLS